MTSGRPLVETMDEAGTKPHVAVVLLHWGLLEVTTRCLQSLAHAGFPGRLTVLLVDNTRSLDPALAGAAAPLPVEVHRPERNLGFAKGCSWGIARAAEHGADYVLLLNNDVVVEPSFLDALLGAAGQRPDAGVLCPQILSPRKLWYAGGTFSLWSGIPVQERPMHAAPLAGHAREVDYATGCAMLIDTAVVDAIGSFDPQFFMYCEDLDFSLRARRAGFKILLVPASRVHHAVSDEAERVSLRIYYSTRNLLEVMRRHAAWYQWPGFVVNFLVRWLGFFTLLACARRRPQFIPALVGGIADFLRGRLGERSSSARA
jgi:GT2 family glycosyltransferase